MIFIVLRFVVVKTVDLLVATFKKRATSVVVDNIEINDEQSISIIFSYLVPLISPFLGFFEENAFNQTLILYVIYIFLFVIFLSMINKVQPNPVLVLLGYHFYKIRIVDGVDGYMLISRRNITNKKQISSCIELFDYSFLDVKG